MHDWRGKHRNHLRFLGRQGCQFSFWRVSRFILPTCYLLTRESSAKTMFKDLSTRARIRVRFPVRNFNYDIQTNRIGIRLFIDTNWNPSVYTFQKENITNSCSKHLWHQIVNIIVHGFVPEIKREECRRPLSKLCLSIPLPCSSLRPFTPLGSVLCWVSKVNYG
jgi:hypothetical protein